jgi:hypothetical protein
MHSCVQLVAVYVRVYVCTYVCMYLCVYVCVYVCMYICMYVCVYVCMYICMYVCVYVCMHICLCVCMYAYVCFPSCGLATSLHVRYWRFCARGLVIIFKRTLRTQAFSASPQLLDIYTGECDQALSIDTHYMQYSNACCVWMRVHSNSRCELSGLQDFKH